VDQGWMYGGGKRALRDNKEVSGQQKRMAQRFTVEPPSIRFVYLV